MELIKAFKYYQVFWVKYSNEYWIINRPIDAREAVAENLSMAMAKAEALEESLCRFISEGVYEETQ